ncbi:MAG TPA: threonine ammonia-lyase [Acidimicrobiales bacterium]|nr:threonine ammonia-lyase [Acidimicrobiales bacterium]
MPAVPADQGPVTLDDILDARERLAPVLRRTPAEESDALSRLTRRRIHLKPEHRQRTGSFKLRGAYNLVSRLEPGVPVVAASAGNHAQGVALAASLTGHPATIFMPASAPLPKVQATRDYGATITLAGDAVDDAIEAARRHADATGAVYVPPFDHPLIVAGQGTIGVELADELPPDVTTVVVPVGGGGLISGIAVALAARRPDVEVVGVQAAGAASMAASLAEGHVVRLDALHTMADGIALKTPCALTLGLVERYVSRIVTVTEEEISRALLLLVERAKWVVEPAGATSFAAVLAGHVAGEGAVACVLSGGNIDPLLLIRVIEHGLSAAGRYVVLRVVMDDTPGSLARLTSAIAERGLNILSVEHRRAGLALPMTAVEVVLTMETRDPEHRAETVEWLRDKGYAVDLLR